MRDKYSGNSPEAAYFEFMPDGKTVPKHEHSRHQMAFLYFETWGDHKPTRKPRGNPAIMCHCSAGCQRSVGVLICYIGRQMWMDKLVVNPLCIWRHIRRHRAYALRAGYFNINEQWGMIAAVLQVICSRITLAEAGVPGSILRREGEIFNKFAPKGTDSTAGKSTKSRGSLMSAGRRRGGRK